MEITLLLQQQQLWHKALRHSAWLFVKEGLAIVEREKLFFFLMVGVYSLHKAKRE